MTITQESFERINSDLYGNPRYVIHYLECMPECYNDMDISERYAATCKLMNKIGGRKHHTRSYGGGIAFQSYNLNNTIAYIQNAMLTASDSWNNLPKKRKYELYERILLDSADSQGFEEYPYFNDCKTDKDKAVFLYGRFISEYGWRAQQVGELKALTEWLQGLALNIPYMNHEILKIAGMLNESERKQDNFLGKYWKFMAMRLQGIWSYFDIQD